MSTELTEGIKRQPLEITFREENRDKFESVRAWREKMFETRAATPKYQAIRRGDRLIFRCGEDRVERVVFATYHFNTIEEMFEHMPIEEILPGVESIEEALRIYYSFPGYKEDIARYGIIAIEFACQEE